jgi:hypothetical protein
MRITHLLLLLSSLHADRLDSGTLLRIDRLLVVVSSLSI